MKKIVSVSFFLLAVSRFINLGKIPIFIDEQTYLRLGKTAIENPDALFLSLKFLVSSKSLTVPRIAVLQIFVGILQRKNDNLVIATSFF